MTNQLIDRDTKKKIREWAMVYITNKMEKDTIANQADLLLQIYRTFKLTRGNGPRRTLMDKEIRSIISLAVGVLAEAIEGVEYDPHKLTVGRGHVVIGKILDLYPEYPNETQKLIDNYHNAGVTLSTKASRLGLSIAATKVQKGLE